VTLTLTLGMSAAVACKAKDTAAPSDPAAIVRVPMGVRAVEDTNDGRPFHIIVRAVSRETFVEDDYAEVSQLVVAPDESVVADVLVFPGAGYALDLEFAAAPEGVGVYGLFTGATGDSWKLFFEGAKTIEISVTGHRLALPEAP
jgi:predicted component of type VI protein secretion system